uniref:NADH dehydrogenase subunit 2 n=1 Tax=Limnonectes blythii TaxID=109962 RepID=UPI00226C92E7|nr:NADH dehydrogenase subunit 2 [Limnonectes blythii]UZC57491.1 NADH dehydrogenase subunit 2 [Limnonectes blythii]
MNPTALMILLTSLALGTTTVLMSHHWLLAWIGLEINTLAIIPLMTKYPHPRAIEAATKYFLTQASASALILFSSSINAWFTGEWLITTMQNPLSITAISMALALKLGLAPFHFWLPEVLQGVPLLTGLILSTWQKIAPMILLIQISHLLNLNLLIILAIASTLVGGWGGINQTQLRKIMAFSSIGHLGWMIVILKFSPQLTLYTFLFYITMTTTLFLSLMSNNVTKMLELSSAWPKSPILITTTMWMLLSLAGLPPLSGFSPKLLITMELIKQNTIALAAIILLTSLIALFFYIRLTYIIILILPPNTLNSLIHWRTNKTNPFTAIFTSLGLFIFPLTPTLFFIL